jgi:hypothetical protein
MKKIIKLTVFIMLSAIFFFISCKKDKIQQRFQSPSPSSQKIKELVIKNLSWKYDAAGKMAFANLAIPSNYSVDSISNVFRLFVFFGTWNKVLKDGTSTHIVYYTIVNGQLMLYYFPEILFNDPNTDIQYVISTLLMNLHQDCNTIKVGFF